MSIVLLISLAAAAPLLVLPPGQDPSDWAGPAELAGVNLMGGDPRVEIRDLGAAWEIRVNFVGDGPDGRAVVITEPVDGAGRERVAALARSLSHGGVTLPNPVARPTPVQPARRPEAPVRAVAVRAPAAPSPLVAPAPVAPPVSVPPDPLAALAPGLPIAASEGPLPWASSVAPVPITPPSASALPSTAPRPHPSTAPPSTALPSTAPPSTAPLPGAAMIGAVAPLMGSMDTAAGAEVVPETPRPPLRTTAAPPLERRAPDAPAPRFVVRLSGQAAARAGTSFGGGVGLDAGIAFGSWDVLLRGAWGSPRALPVVDNTLSVGTLSAGAGGFWAPNTRIAPLVGVSAGANVRSYSLGEQRLETLWTPFAAIEIGARLRLTDLIAVEGRAVGEVDLGMTMLQPGDSAPVRLSPWQLGAALGLRFSPR